MPKNPKSPFATSFNSAIKRGVPCFTAVQQISKRTGKSPSVIFQSLFNAGCCFRQKVNGQWCYWPATGKKSPSFSKPTQNATWQCFIDWCLASGCCTPKQLKSNSSNPSRFFNFLCNCWSKNFGKPSSFSKSTPSSRWSSPSKSNSKPRTKKSRKPGRTATKSYRFPSFKTKKSSTSTTRKYRQAA